MTFFPTRVTLSEDLHVEEGRTKHLLLEKLTLLVEEVMLLVFEVMLFVTSKTLLVSSQLLAASSQQLPVSAEPLPELIGMRPVPAKLLSVVAELHPLEEEALHGPSGRLHLLTKRRRTGAATVSGRDQQGGDAGKPRFSGTSRDGRRERALGLAVTSEEGLTELR
jgi:hypothetical protein